MRSLAVFICLTVEVIIIASCTKQMANKTTMPSSEQGRTCRIPGDTVTYIVELADRKEKKMFVRSFEEFLNGYSFDTLQADTIRHYLKLGIAPVPEREREMAVVDKSEFSETDIVIEGEVGDEAIEKPVCGGKVVWYSERPFIDDTYAKLISSMPFGNQSGDADIGNTDKNEEAEPYPLLVQKVSSRKVRIALTDILTGKTGKPFGAFDLVNSWTEYVRNRPADGLAIFRHVAGIQDFINGKEAVIRGIQIVDDRTINLNLDNEDPYVIDRMTTMRLMPFSVGYGPYYLGKRLKENAQFLPNSTFSFERPFLDQIEMILGNDKNPFVSYSLKKYDIVDLSEIKDLEYARRSLEKNSNIRLLTKDVYFISLAGADVEMRNYIRRAIDPKEILTGAVKAEGEVIACIESDNCSPLQADRPSSSSVPQKRQPLRILFRSDDPVSKRIAEKVLAAFSRNNLQCLLCGNTALKYEQALLAMDYDCAIGWAGESVRREKSERLRLAACWFGDEYDEMERIKNSIEIPLFSINRYILFKKHIGFYKNKLAGIYIKKE